MPWSNQGGGPWGGGGGSKGPWGSGPQSTGPTPPDLDSAYLCQDEAIRLWNDPIAGWKVGWIPDSLSSKFGANRLVGPIFNGSVQRSNGNHALEAPCTHR